MSNKSTEEPVSLFTSAELVCSRPNNPYIKSNTKQACAIVDGLFEQYLAFRKTIKSPTGKPKRSPSANQAERYKKHLNNLILDLYSAYLNHKQLFVGYSRGKSQFVKGGRYYDHVNDMPLLSQRIYLELINFLDSYEYLINVIRDVGDESISSRMRSTPKLFNLMEVGGINWACIKTDITLNAIVVKDKDKNPIELPDPNSFDIDNAKANLLRINTVLEKTLINLAIPDDEYDQLREDLYKNNDIEREPLEFSNRTLRRIFAYSSYDHGGRFYGGWWQGCPKQLRKHIRIQGQKVTVEMDFSTIQPRILYAMVDEDAPNDSYQVDGWDHVDREVRKKAFNQLINSDPSSKPKAQWHRFAPDYPAKSLPPECKDMNKGALNKFKNSKFETEAGREYKDLLSDLYDKHKPIDECFFSKSWSVMQRKDSDIAERVMIKMLDNGVVALPIHDSFIVRIGFQNDLIRAMEESFKEIVGVECKIDKKEVITENAPNVPQSSKEYQDYVLDMIRSHLGYTKREAQWKLVRGMGGWD
jgi:hypothetical protein